MLPVTQEPPVSSSRRTPGPSVFETPEEARSWVPASAGKTSEDEASCKESSFPRTREPSAFETAEEAGARANRTDSSSRRTPGPSVFETPEEPRSWIPASAGTTSKDEASCRESSFPRTREPCAFETAEEPGALANPTDSSSRRTPGPSVFEAPEEARSWVPASAGTTSKDEASCKESSFPRTREPSAFEAAEEAGALANPTNSSSRRKPGPSVFETPEEARNWIPAFAGTTSEEQSTSEGLLSNTADRATLIRTALATLGQRQLLCALRETAFGSVAINAALEALLRRAWQVDAHAEWYPGRAVIITRNDYPAGLFNGDVGLCLADADGRLRVWFETTAGEGGDTGVRSFAPHTLPTHEPAFAITIHKSQGSEYRHAAVLLPPDADHRILSRQLLYTGVSRAKQSVEVWSTQESLDAAVVTEVRRAGGLQGRLDPA
ncbi:MAG: ATP-binding domain-containing protein [Rhodanobacteraceae bacterium]|nr:ATP-binding domain-containing protein [Rhodanobacteraceae bacterium]